VSFKDEISDILQQKVNEFVTFLEEDPESNFVTDPNPHHCVNYFLQILKGTGTYQPINQAY